MVENSEEIRRRKFLKCFSSQSFDGIVAAVAFLCFITSALCLLTAFILFCSECPLPNSHSALTTGAISILLFIAGAIFILCGVRYIDKTQADVLSSHVSFVSDIPAEDLNRSPAAMFSCNDAVPALRESSTTTCPMGDNLSDYFSAVTAQNTSAEYLRDLPDYFTAVQNDEISIFSDGHRCQGNDLPPCYERAIEMPLSSATTS